MVYQPIALTMNSATMLITSHNTKGQWSTSFPIHEVGTLHVKLQDSQSAQFSLVRIEVRLKGATVQVILTEADDVPPFRIENKSFVPLTYHQDGVSLVSTIGPSSSTSYTWDDLSKDLIMVLCVEGVAYKSARAYDLGRVHVGHDLHYPQQFYIIGPHSMHGARFSTGIHTRRCHWFTRRCSA
jgi:hypothetical protein